MTILTRKIFILIVRTMITPIEVRRAAGRYAGGDTRLASAFIQGWLFAHPEYGNVEEAATEGHAVTMEAVIIKWLEYKKEKRQTYKPRGLEAFKKRLTGLSGGDPVIANAIVEQSMANNYAGVFPLKNNNNANGQQSNIIDKVADILAD